MEKPKTRICKNKDCPYAGEEQPIENFRTNNHGTSWRTECRECERIYKRKNRLENPEKYKEQKKVWDKRYREKNREKLNLESREYYWNNRERLKKYRDENRDRYKMWNHIYSAKKRSRLLDAMPPDADIEKINEFYRKARELTELTGVQHHVDHIIPLALGGKHHQDNLQVLTAEENLKKGKKSPEQWEEYKLWEENRKNNDA